MTSAPEALTLRQQRAHVLGVGRDRIILEHRLGAELGEVFLQQREAALAVGGGVADQRDLGLLHHLDDIARVRDLDLAIVGKEAEDVRIAALGDLGEPGDCQQRHFIFGGDRHHGDHFGAEYCHRRGSRFLTAQRFVERGGGAGRRRSGIEDRKIDFQSAGCLLERHHGAVALAAAFDRQKAGDRHHDRQIGVSGVGNSAGNPSQAQSDHERRESVAQCPCLERGGIRHSPCWDWHRYLLGLRRVPAFLLIENISCKE